MAGQHREHGRADDVALRGGGPDRVVRGELRDGAAGGGTGSAALACSKLDSGVQALKPGAISEVEGCGPMSHPGEPTAGSPGTPAGMGHPLMAPAAPFPS